MVTFVGVDHEAFTVTDLDHPGLAATSREELEQWQRRFDDYGGRLHRNSRHDMGTTSTSATPCESPRTASARRAGNRSRRCRDE